MTDELTTPEALAAASPVVGGDERRCERLLQEISVLNRALRQACHDGWADGDAAMASYLADAQPAPSAPTPVSDERLATVVSRFAWLADSARTEGFHEAAAAYTVCRDELSDALTPAAAPSPTDGERPWVCVIPDVDGACSPDDPHMIGTACGPAPTDGERGTVYYDKFDRPMPPDAPATFPCKVQQAGSGTCTWPTCGCGDA